MREFTYLVPGKKGTGRNSTNTVLMAYTRQQLRGKPILWSQKNYHYYVFESLAELEPWYEGYVARKAAEGEPDAKRHFFEVIFADLPQRLKLDFDKVMDTQVLATCMRAVKVAWRAWRASSGAAASPPMYLFRTSEFGYHVVIDQVVAGAAKAKEFAALVDAEIRKVAPELVDDADHSPLDMRVYSNIQNFRLMGSTKPDGGWSKVCLNDKKVALRNTMIIPYEN